MSKTQNYKLPRPERTRKFPSSLHERADTPELGSMNSLSGVNPRPNAQLLAEYSASEYKSIISQYIKKQMIILGPVVAVEKARKVDKIRINDDGTVTQIIGDSKEVMAMVESEYEGMIGSIANTVLLRIIDKSSEAVEETNNV